MVEQRNRAPEQMLQERERELGIVQGHFTKLKKDFTLNLNLFAELVKLTWMVTWTAPDEPNIPSGETADSSSHACDEARIQDGEFG
jgi:hypothetical protein